MAHVMCAEAVEVLNLVFGVPLVFNDGHDIVQRLRAGDEVADIVEDLGKKFGSNGAAQRVRSVVDNWDPLHVEAVGEVVRWALGKLDTDDRIQLMWKGDATSPETVTRFELRDHTLMIEFAHPPAGVAAAGAGVA